MRYRHCLSAVRGDAMPRAVVAVDCEYEEAQDRDRPKRLSRSLRSWHAVAALMDRGRTRNIREAHGTDAKSWWMSLEWLLRRGGVTWIISCPAGRAIALLGVWEELEYGRLRVNSPDHRSRDIHSGGLHPLREQFPADGDGPRRPADEIVPGVWLGDRDKAAGVDRPTQTDSPLVGAGYLVLEDPPTVIHARVAGTTGTIHWVDSRNYGVDLADPEHTAADTARGLHKFALDMVATLKAHKLGGLRDTSGSQAMSAFRRAHLQSVIVCHTELVALDLERAAYYGGRSEAYHIGRVEGPVYHYDFRSLYPSVCVAKDLPVRLRYVSSEHLDAQRSGTERLDRCIADVTVETARPDYPKRLGPIVVYPVGRFRTQLAGPELVHAAERGRVCAWHAVAEYDLEPALRSFASEVDQIRKEAERTGNGPLARWAKSLGVCLPGKFGQRERHWKTVSCSPPFGFYDEWYQLRDGQAPERWRTIAGVTQCEVVGGLANDAVPAIAAWVTSAARMRLLDAIEDAGWDHVWYVDTDSLFVDEVGSERLVELGHVSTGEMGYLKVEGVYSEMEIRGIKDYSCDGRHVSAGVPKGHKDKPGSAEEYWWSPWIGLATSTHQRPTADAVLRRYHRVQPYRHGTILAGGKVVPLQIWE